MPAAHIAFHEIGGEQAAGRLSELRALYSEVHADPPYEWADDHGYLFTERFEVQCRQESFALAEARAGRELAGFAYGVTLQPSTPCWRNLTTTLPPEVTTERPAVPSPSSNCSSGRPGDASTRIHRMNSDVLITP
jgi:hypothetical protein